MAQTDGHENQFNQFKKKEEEHLADFANMLAQAEQVSGGAQGQSSLLQQQYGPGNLGQNPFMPMGMRQMPMPMQPAMVPPPWTNMAAMFTPSGQNFGVPGGLVGRRPSLLQVGADSPAMGRDLQAKLDNEAAQLEAEELGGVD